MTPDQLGPVFCRNLRALRVAKGWSQRRLAESLETSSPVVVAWEKGHKSPTLSSISKLCVVLDVRPEDLLGETTADLVMPHSA
ncbi:MAG: helix-turn-helix transcriptional regulator [Planctomycetaceae bacterium]|nr:helix-turn-helix transcriptional regulator [Planctomycetaceae bacterium]